ncbi:MAG: hypothetical protein EHM72_18650 [Calditrichaeota bacterium]|nr:MAG: hypothetical protein EHM72_18650 [Calditrichota bacterium]
MALFNRKWTPHQADEWTREDWLAIIISPFSYILLTLGVAMSLFLLPMGFVFLGIGIVITVIMFWIIDPKLRAISQGYEKKQREYLQELEKIQRWEE